MGSYKILNFKKVLTYFQSLKPIIEILNNFRNNFSAFEYSQEDNYNQVQVQKLLAHLISLRSQNEKYQISNLLKNSKTSQKFNPLLQETKYNIIS